MQRIATIHFRYIAAKLQKTVKTCKKLLRMAYKFAFVNLFCYLCIMNRIIIYCSCALMVACMTACRATRTITITATTVTQSADTTLIQAGVVEDYQGVKH